MMYSLDEIGLIPARVSNITHRDSIKPYTSDGKLPIFAAPMTCVVNEDNFDAFNARVYPILPRQKELKTPYAGDWQAMSLQQFKHWFNTCKAADNVQYRILIDIANGHMSELFSCVEDAKQEYGDNLIVMIGNIANPETYKECCYSHADYVRVGIGGGSACLTGVQTGIHASMPWLLTEISKIREEIKGKTKVIADGGINTIDKAIKCLALGADYVMMGKLFAQCEEACGDLEYVYGKKMRNYYGMASLRGQRDISKGGVKNPEGMETLVPVEYSLNEFLDKFEASLRSCMSYCNAKTLDRFIGKVNYEVMTNTEFKAYYK